MLYVGDREIPSSDDHEGFVAGRYRDGAYSDIWTDVRRCSERTFLAYAASCECGWRGPDQPPTGEGHKTALQAWLNDHFALLVGTDDPFTAEDFLTA